MIKKEAKNLKNKFTGGFTLAEMLVVVIIIAILASIAYPLYMKAVTKSRAVEAFSLLDTVRNKQIQKFAKDREYYTDFSKMGQLTTDRAQETISGQELKVNDYTVKLNTEKNCISAKYQKGNNSFTMSTGYETSGIGCTGNVCKSFGDIIGSSEEVCNCGSKTCNGGYTLDEGTCNCSCNLGCTDGNSCYSPTQTQPTSQSCGNGGTQTRYCSASCSGGACGAWSACSGGSTPCSGSKPAESQACGNCNLGTQTRTVTCDTSNGSWQTGTWGACSGGGTCSPGATQTCNTTGTQTCSSSCSWGSCSGGTGGCDSSQKTLCSSSGGTWNNSTCKCSCTGAKTWDASDGCKCSDVAAGSACGSSGGTWDVNGCSCDCGDTKTWDSTNLGCACPASVKTSCTNGGGTLSESDCSCSCTNGKTWDKDSSACVCSDTKAESNCTGSKGTWSNKTCTCTCEGKNYYLSNGKCVAKFKAQKIKIGVLVNCHYCPDGLGWRSACNGSNDTDCYDAGQWNSGDSCSSATSNRESSQFVISYEFYVGGSFSKRAGGQFGGGDPEDAYLWWTGGTRIGGSMSRYSGGSMLNCGTPQDFCDRNCDAKSSSCDAKCLVSMSTSGCTNPRYKYCWHKCGPTRYSASNSSGSGVVAVCK